MKKRNISNIIHWLLPHLTLFEDGSVINDRYVNYQCTLNEVVNRLSQ
ncbi:MAG: hypothetical protein KMY54_03260 [Erysipelothrix sp.]|nr:hypothetical protein [Erysipelothrix sp.]